MKMIYNQREIIHMVYDHINCNETVLATKKGIRIFLKDSDGAYNEVSGDDVIVVEVDNLRMAGVDPNEEENKDIAYVG